MRFRLRILLPTVLALLAALVFLLAGLTIAEVVRTEAAAGEEPGAVAGRVLALWGVLAVGGALLAGGILARFLSRQLQFVRDSIDRQSDDGEGPSFIVAEVRDLAAAMKRARRRAGERLERESREREGLAALVDSVSEGIVQLDRLGRVVRLNRAARRLLKLAPDAEGRSVSVLVRDEGLRRLLERGAAGRGPGAAEVALEDRRVLVATAALTGGGSVATILDITDLRRLEEVRRDFVANASHELKTPLTSIRGYTETLLDGDLPPAEQRQFLETVARNAERLQHTVDDLLDLSRLESGRWEPNLEAVDLVAAAGEGWEAFRGRARTAGVAFDVSREDGGQVMALADRRALEQILANLYDNALRYTEDGGRITVRVATTEESPPSREGVAGDTPAAVSRWVVMEVRDTGRGIPRDALPRIFERFYRVDPARSREEGGTGLGLSIVRHMMASMGGAVSAESQLGRGTTIRLWLRPA
ncbi:MAG TPA: ATP-binding protein [Longimicrobiales bacterium]|nr:ATP-binding protein [Longimicrobiales bacterium]